MHGLASSAFRRACVASSSVRRLRAKTARGARGVFSRATPVVRAMAAPSTSAPLSGDAQVAYDALTSRLKKLSALDAIEATIQWDELVMMPESAAEARGNQKAVLAELKHLEATSEAHAAAIASAESAGAADGCPWRAAVVRDARRDYNDAVRLSAELKAREASLGAAGYAAWVKARENDDFAAFAPVLLDLVDLRKEMARQCADEGVKPYDYLIDRFERGMTSERLEEIFGALRSSLVPVISKCLDAEPLDHPRALTEGVFPEAAQEAFCRHVAAKMGFDFDAGRFDRSVHPFTGGAGPHDVRITTRYDEKNFMDAVMGTIHEVGHALYEQGLSKDRDGLPVQRALSMGIHESQSLFWERYVGQSREFWRAMHPAFLDAFPHCAEAGVTAEDLYRYVNKASAGFIRVDADELTYSMHVVLRFEMERDLIGGAVDVAELPDLWRRKMRELLGVVPEADQKGVLQDVHWSDGSFGYFPSYTLGAMYACQFHAKAREEIEGFDASIERGEFSEVREWLRAKIHDVGSLHPSADDLCEAVTGAKLDPSVYVKHLDEKYSALYGL